jgi:hypothetical protein
VLNPDQSTHVAGVLGSLLNFSVDSYTRYMNQHVQVVTVVLVVQDKMDSTTKTGSLSQNFETPSRETVVTHSLVTISHELLLIVDIGRVKHLLCKLLVCDWLVMLLSNCCYKRRLGLNDAVGRWADKVRDRVPGRCWLALGFT